MIVNQIFPWSLVLRCLTSDKLNERYKEVVFYYGSDTGTFPVHVPQTTFAPGLGGLPALAPAAPGSCLVAGGACVPRGAMPRARRSWRGRRRKRRPGYATNSPAQVPRPLILAS